jgi:ribosome-binding protein aMBF1 (putative translation factor)
VRGECVMKKKSASTTMKIMGATLAVCSAVAMMGASKADTNSMKKTMKKTADKVMDFVDTVVAFM